MDLSTQVINQNFSGMPRSTPNGSYRGSVCHLCRHINLSSLYKCIKCSHSIYPADLFYAEDLRPSKLTRQPTICPVIPFFGTRARL